MTRSSTESCVVAESPLAQATFFRGQGSTLLLTFSPSALVARPGDFWTKPISAKLQIPTLSFDARGRHWWPLDDTRDLVERVRRRLDLSAFQRIVAYGFSMGGYGVLKHAAFVGADTTIALSPQYSIDPDVVGKFENRYTASFISSFHRDMAITGRDLAARNIIIADPLERIDMQHLELIGRQGAFRLVPAAGFGHNSVAVVSSTGSAGRFFELILSHQSNLVSQLRTLFRQRRASSPIYWKVLSAFAQRNRHPRLAAALLLRATDVHPRSGELQLQLAQTLLKSGDRLQARVHATRATQLGEPQSQVFLDASAMLADLARDAAA